MPRAPQIRLSLNEVEFEKLKRWAEAGGHKPATKATHIVRVSIEQAEASGDIPPPPPEGDAPASEARPDVDDFQALLALVVELGAGAKPSKAAIAQAAKVAKIDPHQLNTQLEKLGGKT